MSCVEEQREPGDPGKQGRWQCKLPRDALRREEGASEGEGPMGYEIRAMSFAEIMDTGFRIVRQHFGLIIGIAAALYVPIAILGALVAPEPVPGAGPWGGVGAGRLGFLIGLVLYAVVVSPIVAEAITYAIGEV